jgi:phosphatidylglycerol:prolipoprotein diacylglycerol transferase
MNDLIRTCAEMGIGMTMYNIFFGLGFVSVLIGLVWFGKKLEIPLWKSAVTVLIVYPAVVLWMFVMYWMESGFRSFGGNNIVRIFVYVPVIGVPVTKLLKLDTKKVLSFLAPAPLFVHGVSHFGCVFAGCCYGYPCDWGVWSPRTGELLFPIQPIEALGAVAIIVYLILRAKKRNYVPDGLEYPLMLVLYGSSRFIFEFFRDNYKLLWGCSNLAFHALFMFVVGVIWIVVARKKAKN